MRIVETSAIIRVEPNHVLNAFTKQELLKGWWGVEKSIVETHPGGLYILAWQTSDDGIQYVSTGIVKTYRPGQEISVHSMAYITPDKPILGPMRLTVNTKQTDSGTYVQILQDGYGEGDIWDWYYEAVVDAWPKAMETLKSFLESEV